MECDTWRVEGEHHVFSRAETGGLGNDGFLRWLEGGQRSTKSTSTKQECGGKGHAGSMKNLAIFSGGRAVHWGGGILKLIINNSSSTTLNPKPYLNLKPLPFVLLQGGEASGKQSRITRAYCTWGTGAPNKVFRRLNSTP